VNTTATRVKTFPVVEVFGPTIQGEGWMAGLPSYFVRFGGCDWRCSWCDSPHAVLPELVREHAEKMTAQEIVGAIRGAGAQWVTFSGGNPALLELGALVDLFKSRQYKVSVETQGSRWRDWLGHVSHLTISPKPPSSGEASIENGDAVDAFMGEALASGVNASLKIVVFDEHDFEWALVTADAYPWLPFYISTGTRSLERESLEATADRYRRICDLLAADYSPVARRARVLPQLHVIAWGHRRGV